LKDDTRDEKKRKGESAGSHKRSLSHPVFSCSAVLRDPIGRKYFAIHMRKTQSAENILFDRKVELFRESLGRGDMGEARRIAVYIKNQFLVEPKLDFRSGLTAHPLTTPTPINIDGGTREALLSSISDGQFYLTMFDCAQMAIRKLIRTDCFPRFKKSREFLRYLHAQSSRGLPSSRQFKTRQPRSPISARNQSPRSPTSTRRTRTPRSPRSPRSTCSDCKSVLRLSESSDLAVSESTSMGLLTPLQSNASRKSASSLSESAEDPDSATRTDDVHRTEMLRAIGRSVRPTRMARLLLV